MRIKAYVHFAALAIMLSVVPIANAQYPAGGQFPMMGYGPMMAPGMPIGPNIGMPMIGPSPIVQAAFQDTGGTNTEGCAGQCGGACGDCCGCGWNHRISAFGEFLYLRARDAEVAYGVPIDGAIIAPPSNPIQIGRVGVVDQDFDPGFRVGFSYVLDCYSSITAQYTMFETGRIDSISTSAPNVIRSLVAHPGTLNAAEDYLNATAQHDISIDLIDLDYRNVFSCCDDYKAMFLVGARYANLEQQFNSTFTATGVETVVTDIDFDGVGLRVGLEGERYVGSGRLWVYGKTAASLVAGEFRTSYTQSRSFDPTIVDTTWEAGRIVPILDLEVGGGWTSACGTWRLSAGYVFSAWYNTVKTDEWIHAVQQNNFLNLGDTMTFDGLVARIEGRF
jgi:hypothetical protein